MTDPDRLLSELPGDLGRTLIEAGVEEQPSELARRRALIALGVAAPVLGVGSVVLGASAVKGAAAGSALTSGSVTSGIVIAKWLGTGLAAGVLATTAVQIVQRPAAEPARVVAPAAVMAPKNEPVVPVAPTPRVEQPVPEPPVAELAAAPVAVEVETEAALPLAREVAFVDRGRALLEGGNAAGAALALRDYEREFPQPKLLPEVWVLRMRAAERAGDSAGARILAARLVEVFPKSPHSARARALLERVTKQEQGL
jgi:hypothetical protein